MTRRPRLVAGLVLAASVGLLAGCGAADAGVDPDGPAVSGLADGDVDTDATDDAVDEDLYADVPDECREAFPLAFGPASIADVTLQPADWPAAPDGATLCVTAEAIGGTTETASYATAASIDEVLAYYESATTGYGPVRESGDENGTGYETLRGGDDVFGFQIRQSEGGFVLSFAVGDTES